MDLFLIIVFAILVVMTLAIVETSKKGSRTVSNKNPHKGSFDERGRFVRSTGPNTTKVGHITVQTNKGNNFSRHNERDSVQDPPLSEAEKNVILGK